MKVLLTGAEGYIGSVLAPYLMQRGHSVIGVDTGYYRQGWLYNEAFKFIPPCINKHGRQITLDELRGSTALST
jgi:nucleoside-diphosphate-sugar epimerase